MKRDPALIGLSHDHHHALSRARKLRRAASADSAGSSASGSAGQAISQVIPDRSDCSTAA